MSDTTPVGPPPSGPPPGPPPSRAGTRKLAIAALVVVVVVGSAVGVLVLSGGSDTATASVRTEPISTANDPYAPADSVGTDQSIPAVPTDGAVTVEGGHEGLYGGTLNQQVCDKDKLVTFLEQNPDKGSAWASTLGISPAQIPSYVEGLTPVLLRSDTLVTNHGFKDGHATSSAAVLQAGTAVLVDDRGVPVTKCYCGNPLTAPPSDSSSLTYSGPRWKDFSETDYATVTPNTTVITDYVLVDPATKEGFTRPAGTDGSEDAPTITQPSSSSNNGGRLTDGTYSMQVVLESEPELGDCSGVTTYLLVVNGSTATRVYPNGERLVQAVERHGSRFQLTGTLDSAIFTTDASIDGTGDITGTDLIEVENPPDAGCVFRLTGQRQAKDTTATTDGLITTSTCPPGSDPDAQLTCQTPEKFRGS